jgi:hypothetical protein
VAGLAEYGNASIERIGEQLTFVCHFVSIFLELTVQQILLEVYGSDEFGVAMKKRAKIRTSMEALISYA